MTSQPHRSQGAPPVPGDEPRSGQIGVVKVGAVEGVEEGGEGEGAPGLVPAAAHAVGVEEVPFVVVVEEAGAARGVVDVHERGDGVVLHGGGGARGERGGGGEVADRVLAGRAGVVARVMGRRWAARGAEQP